MYKLGIDLGGTKIEGVVLDASGKQLFRERIPTQQEEGYDFILAQIKKVYELLKSEIKDSAHTLGMGTPGAISSKTGFLKNSNTVCFNGKLTQSIVEELLGRALIIENDANCFALAETLHGAGQGANVAFGVIMGTGCGGGVVVNGKVLHGLQGIGGEWGHMSIDPEGPLCYCGQRGCVETFISGGGLQRQYVELYGIEKTVPEILEDEKGGCEKAVPFMAKFYDRFGRSMANLINILDPDKIILGGGLSNIEDLYTRGRKSVESYVFNDELKTEIVKNKLGDSAGVIGAALIGR